MENEANDEQQLGETLCDRLKALRGRMTLKSVGALLGIPYNQWAGYEHGVSRPSFENIYRICTKFDCSADWLLGIQKKGAPKPKAPASIKEPAKCATCCFKKKVEAMQHFWDVH